MTTETAQKLLVWFGAAILVAYAILNVIAPAGRQLAKIRGEDPVNYFGIAHSILFDQDFNLTNEFDHVPPNSRDWTPQQKTGMPGSPWGIGYSVLEVPLLAAGTALDKLAGNPADGYSEYAILLYCFGSPLFTGIGLVALYHAVRHSGEFSGRGEVAPAVALTVVMSIFFGTNVGYYSFAQLSHASTFMLAGIYLWRWLLARRGDDMRLWALAGLAGGLLSVTRWQDLLYCGGALLYELANGGILHRGKSWWRSRLTFTGMILLCWIPQVAEWKVIYNKYLTIPQGPGFLRFPPEWVGHVMFSTRNGWFTWTPLVVLCCVGLVWGAVKRPRLFGPWSVVLILEIMVVGAMKTWHGVDSFGARYLLSMAPILALGLCVLLVNARGPAKPLLQVAIVVSSLFCSIFAVQYRFDLMATGDRLTVNEILWDKFHLGAAKTRRDALVRANATLEKGDVRSAVAELEAARAWGADRKIEAALSRAYKAAGDDEGASQAAGRYQQILASRLF